MGIILLHHQEGLGEMRATLDEKFRLLIPAEIRRKAGFHPGESVAVEVVGPGEIRVIRMEELVKEARGIYGHLKLPGEDVTESLLKERRIQAAREDIQSE